VLFQHVERPSFIHSLNPMVKFLAIVIAVLTMTLFFDPIPTLFMTGLALFLILILARIPPWVLIKSVLPFLGLAIGLAWVNAFFSRPGGETLLAWHFIRVTGESLRMGVTLGLRVLTIVLFSYLFAATTDPRDLALSMVQQARLPYKMAFGLFAGFRFLPLLGTEFETIRAAHRIRGVGEKRGWRGTYRELKRFTIPLSASVIRKASHIGIAMESKGFGAFDKRTYLRETKVTGQDILFLVGLVIVLAVALYLFVQTGLITHLGPQFGTPYQHVNS
jgi:energy-coupling factor transport system permease protein